MYPWTVIVQVTAQPQPSVEGVTGTIMTDRDLVLETKLQWISKSHSLVIFCCWWFSVLFKTGGFLLCCQSLEPPPLLPFSWKYVGFQYYNHHLKL